MGGAGKNINMVLKAITMYEVGQTMGGTGFQDTSHLTGGSGEVVVVEHQLQLKLHKQRKIQVLEDF
jgi:hypothetical protein